MRLSNSSTLLVISSHFSLYTIGFITIIHGHNDILSSDSSHFFRLYATKNQKNLNS